MPWLTKEEQGRRAALLVRGLKGCTRCKETKPLSAFTRNKRKPTGWSDWCSECYKRHYQKHYDEYRTRERAYQKTYRKETHKGCGLGMTRLARTTPGRGKHWRRHRRGRWKPVVRLQGTG